MKVLITGSSGQVGLAVEQVMSKPNIELLCTTHKDLDISNRDQVLTSIASFNPDVIVNAAAMTNVDLCETEVEQAFAINSLGPRHLVQGAQMVDAHLIHISTDFVFDGETNRPYSEFDIPNPLSVYGKSKLGGDQEALSYPKATVLRPAWVFGNPNGDFFSWVLESVKNNSLDKLIGDQISTPTYSKDIAIVVEKIIQNRIFGLINVANQGLTTRLEMGQHVCDLLGIDISFESIESQELSRPALRPNYSALSCDVLKRETGIELRSWKEALEDHLVNLR